MHFADTYSWHAGQRQFNVAINGSPVLTSFDIYGTAGMARKALVLDFPATATASGNISIQFTPVIDNPLICGLEILPM